VRAASGGKLTRGTPLIRQSERYPAIAQAIAGSGAADITAVVLSGQVDSQGEWPHLTVEQISAVNGSLLGTIYARSSDLGFAGTPNGVWLNSDPSGRYLLLSDAAGVGVSVGWIGEGTFHLLPVQLPFGHASVAW
jgi:hypothetical protein